MDEACPTAHAADTATSRGLSSKFPPGAARGQGQTGGERNRDVRWHAGRAAQASTGPVRPLPAPDATTLLGVSPDRLRAIHARYYVLDNAALVVLENVVALVPQGHEAAVETMLTQFVALVKESAP
ncbi:MAG TPA: hypothetical protein VGD56_13785 [Gemmatirosa sp.]